MGCMFEKEQNDYLDLTHELSLVDTLARENIYENFDILCFEERYKKKSNPIYIPLR